MYQITDAVTLVLVVEAEYVAVIMYCVLSAVSLSDKSVVGELLTAVERDIERKRRCYALRQRTELRDVSL